jgi:hypothetical protein
MDRRVGSACLLGLVACACDGSAPALTKSTSANVRRDAIENLRLLGREIDLGRPVLELLLQDPDECVRDAAHRALESSARPRPGK